MFHKINTQTPLSIITLSEAKAQCRIFPTETVQESYLMSCIEQASSLAQVYTNRMLSSGTVSATWDGFKSKVKLWGGNVTSVDSVIGKTLTGTSVVIEGYSFNEISQILTMPSEHASLVEFAASYTCTIATVPNIIKAGVLHLTEYLFNNRGDTVIGMSIEEMPITATRLLDAEKHYVV
jgi:hypothetical protein